MVTSKR